MSTFRGSPLLVIAVLAACEPARQPIPSAGSAPASASAVGAPAADTAGAAALAADSLAVANDPGGSSADADLPIPRPLSVPDTVVLAAFAAAVDTMTTPSTWNAAHAGETVIMKARSDAMSESFCRASLATTEIGGRRALRSAVFQVPNPPAGEALPDTLNLEEQHCRLRGMWLEMVERDRARAFRLADSLAARVDRMAGPSRKELQLDVPGSGQWEAGRTWRGSGRTIVLAVAPPDTQFSDDEVDRKVLSVMPRRLVLVAFAPHSGLDQLHTMEFAGSEGDKDAERELELAAADSALIIAALPRLTADARTLLTRARSVKDGAPVRTTDLDPALMRIASTIHDLPVSLPASRRAAALLAADVVMNSFVRVLAASDDSTRGEEVRRRAFTAAGLKFGHSPLGAVHLYARPWLWDAYRLDPSGLSGRAAFITLLNNGWTTDAACGDGMEEFQRVIEHGEAELARGATDPLIHYYLGLAYNEIVSLSLHGVPGYLDGKEYLPAAPAARGRALQHLRAYLSTPGDRRLRRNAWRTAVALMMGQSWGGGRYVCIYD